MSALNLHFELPKHELVCNLRKLFSGIVSGNIKEEGVISIEKIALYKLVGKRDLWGKL